MARGPDDWLNDWLDDIFISSPERDREEPEVDTGDLPPELASIYERTVMGNPHYERMDEYEKDRLLREFDRGFYSMPYGFDVERSRRRFFEELDLSETEERILWEDWAEWYE